MNYIKAPYPPPVTAEVASSSLVVPAIIFNKLQSFGCPSAGPERDSFYWPKLLFGSKNRLCYLILCTSLRQRWRLRVDIQRDPAVGMAHISSCVTFTSSPLLRSMTEKVWRKVCQPTLLVIPALAMAGFIQRLRIKSGRTG